MTLDELDEYWMTIGMSIDDCLTIDEEGKYVTHCNGNQDSRQAELPNGVLDFERERQAEISRHRQTTPPPLSL